MGETSPAGRDSESGEMTKDKVIVLRRKPLHSPSPRPLKNYRNLIPSSYPLIEEHQRFTGCRIQDMMKRMKQRQGNAWCQYPSGMPSAGHFVNLVRHDRYPKKGLFRVPSEILSNEITKESRNNSNVIYISIWEEFIQGTAVLSKYTKAVADEEYGFTLTIRRHLENFVPSFALDALIYTLYFCIYFVSIILYNNFLELFLYMLCAVHMMIHEKAYANNIDIAFSGSIFQGPAFAFVRFWCQHCQQKETEKVVCSLMKGMKRDILARRQQT